MKESEAIEKLKNMRLFMQIIDKNSKHKFTEDDYKTNEIAIQALEEVQQYRAIGTPEECRTAREKQMPKKPIRHTAWEDFKCPACGSTEIRPYNTEYSEYDKDCKFEYCSDCGQKLDWSDEE